MCKCWKQIWVEIKLVKLYGKNKISNFKLLNYIHLMLFQYNNSKSYTIYFKAYFYYVLLPLVYCYVGYKVLDDCKHRILTHLYIYYKLLIKK